MSEERLDPLGVLAHSDLLRPGLLIDVLLEQHVVARPHALLLETALDLLIASLVRLQLNHFSGQVRVLQGRHLVHQIQLLLLLLPLLVPRGVHLRLDTRICCSARVHGPGKLVIGYGSARGLELLLALFVALFLALLLLLRQLQGDLHVVNGLQLLLLFLLLLDQLLLGLHAPVEVFELNLLLGADLLQTLLVAVDGQIHGLAQQPLAVANNRLYRLAHVFGARLLLLPLQQDLSQQVLMLQLGQQLVVALDHVAVREGEEV